MPFLKGVRSSPSTEFKKGYIPKTCFKKGRIPWNKGKKGVYRLKHSGQFKKGQHCSLKTEFKKGLTPWSKGNELPQFSGENHPNWKGGNPKCIDCGKKLTNYDHQRCLRCSYKFRIGENHPCWKDGISKNKQHRNKWQKEYRHKIGISKKYREEYLGGISKTKEYKKLQRQKRKALIKGGGDLSIKTIQQVYEDNIKHYGTLTCYLCLLPIEFKKDHLEHKIPLSRGGTNIYSNLAIACQSCNCKKHQKTEEEYKGEILEKCLY